MKKEQELLAELDATKREARAKDQTIRVLRERLQANQVEMMSFLNRQLKQEQRRKGPVSSMKKEQGLPAELEAIKREQLKQLNVLFVHVPTFRYN